MAYSRREHQGAAVATTITAGINGTATSISIASSTGWPSGSTAPFWVVIDRGLSSEEKVLVTSRSGTTLTVASSADRGKDGTSAAAHSSGAAIEHCVSAEELDEANVAVKRVLGTGVEVGIPFTITNTSVAALYADKGTQFYAPRAGSIVGISIQVNDTRVSGSITAEVYIDAGATGLTATINGTNTTDDHTLQARGQDTFTAGQAIIVVLTPSSLLPTTNGNVTVWVVFDAFT